MGRFYRDWVSIGSSYPHDTTLTQTIIFYIYCIYDYDLGSENLGQILIWTITTMYYVVFIDHVDQFVLLFILIIICGLCPNILICCLVL